MPFGVFYFATQNVGIQLKHDEGSFCVRILHIQTNDLNITESRVEAITASVNGCHHWRSSVLQCLPIDPLTERGRDRSNSTVEPLGEHSEDVSGVQCRQCLHSSIESAVSEGITQPQSHKTPYTSSM